MSNSTAPAKGRLRLWLRMLQATRRIEAELRERLSREFATTLPRFDVMAALYKWPDGLKMSGLSKKLMVSNGNLTGLVDRLASDGLVERLAVEGDRRAALVRLTGKGRRDFERMALVHEQWVDGLLGELGNEEVVRTTELLTKLRSTNQGPDLPE